MSEKVREAVGDGHLHEVSIDVSELSGWNLKVTNGWNGMLGHFGALTCIAFARQFKHICVDRGPHKLGGNHLTRSCDARVAKSVKGLEYFLPPVERH